MGGAVCSCERAAPKVAELNSLFSEFDLMCERTQVAKIKTIGDASMAVGGLPGTREDHHVAVAEPALGMVEAISRPSGRSGGARDWRVRIGIHTGPAVAGVIGTRKFVYDVWGDTVNVASRVETSAEPTGSTSRRTSRARCATNSGWSHGGRSNSKARARRGRSI